MKLVQNNNNYHYNHHYNYNLHYHNNNNYNNNYLHNVCIKYFATLYNIHFRCSD